MHPSTAQSDVLVDELIRNGVRQIVLCPGSRNAPLAFAAHQAATAGQVELHVRIDERSAGFFALGLARAGQRPVVLICTSGTAATNFHPAIAEASRSSVPLIVLTADRPPELRAAGANQVIDQHRLYGTAVRFFAELAVAGHHPGQNAYWRTQVCRACSAGGPAQLNVPFREPLVPEEDKEWGEPLTGRADSGPWTRMSSQRQLVEITPDSRRGLIVLADNGRLAQHAANWAGQHGWPVLSETGGVGQEGVLAAGMWLLGNPAFVANYHPEQVICVGRPTVFRQVQRLLSGSEVRLVTEQDDWPSPEHNVVQVGQTIAEIGESCDPSWTQTWSTANDKTISVLHKAIDAQEWNTGISVANILLACIPDESSMIVGSSNAARDIALAAHYRPDIPLLRNRGVSGIDGTVSTAVGAALEYGQQTYALLGDLAFLHDINGLLIGPAESRPDLTIVVFNDNGGGIFSLLEQGDPKYSDSFERLFGTPHGANLAQLCAGYHVPHTAANSAAELRDALRPGPGIRVIEVHGQRNRLRHNHDQLREAVASALAGVSALSQ